MWDTLNKNGYLGFTCFGGPPVHFQIVSGSHGLKMVSPASGWHCDLTDLTSHLGLAVPQEIRGEIPMA
jgi:hypothetical protein